MANTLQDGLEKLAGAWREFQTCTPVKLGMVRDDRHYDAMVASLNNLVDEIGDCETHPLMDLLDIVGCFVREYEESYMDIPELRRPAADDGAPTPKLEDNSSPRSSLPTGEQINAASGMRRVEIDLPANTCADLAGGGAEIEAEFRAAAAAKWYELGRVSQEVGAQIAGVSRGEFLTLLSRHQVSPMQESGEEAATGGGLL